MKKLKLWLVLTLVLFAGINCRGSQERGLADRSLQPSLLESPTPETISSPTSTPSPLPTPTLTPIGATTPAPIPTFRTSSTTPQIRMEKARPLIAIDAGHGGPYYPGAVARDAQGRVVLVEKDVNLQVAQLLAEILRSKGYEVLLTRKGDYTLTPFQEGDLTERVKRELQARVDIINQAKADILVSIHFNGHEDASLRGTETYYNARRLFSEKNQRLVEAIQSGIMKSLRTAGYPAIDRGIKTDESIGQRFGQPYSFLLGENPGFRASQMPGIISESLFMTNPQEAELLQNSRMLEAIARGHAEGIEQYISQELEKTLRLPVSPIEISRGDGNCPQVTLTFDAGASSAPAAKIIEILARHKISVTVFPTGQWAERNPELIKQIIANGHELGNHSYSHPPFTELTQTQMKEELAKTEAIVQGLTGQTTEPLFRPPFGNRDARVREIVAQEGYYTIYWTLDSTDWRPEATASIIRDRVLRATSPGSILVFHLGSQATAEALEEIVVGLKERGFSLVTLSELLLGCAEGS